MHAVAQSSARHAVIRQAPGVYFIDLDVSEFTRDELTVETIGQRVTVRGTQSAAPEDVGTCPLARQLEESFRLPDDADAEGIEAVYKHGALEFRARRRQLGRHSVPIDRDRLVSAVPNGS